MGELEEAMQHLRDAEQLSVEIDKAQQELSRKDPSASIVKSQMYVIQVQKSAIKTLLASLIGQESAAKKLESLISILTEIRSASMEASLIETKKYEKEIARLQTYIGTLDKTIEGLKAEADDLRKRIKHLIGES